MSEFSFGSIVPLVPAINIDGVVEFYEHELGFTKLFQEGTYVGLGRDGVEVHLYQTNDNHLSDWSVIRI